MNSKTDSLEKAKYDFKTSQDLHNTLSKIIGDELVFANDSFIKPISKHFNADNDLISLGNILSDKNFWQMILLQNNIFTLYGDLRANFSLSNRFTLESFIRYTHIGRNNDDNETNINYGFDYLLDNDLISITNCSGKAIIAPISQMRSDIDLDMRNKRKIYKSRLSTVNKILSNDKNASHINIYDESTGDAYVCDINTFELMQYLQEKKSILSKLLYYRSKPNMASLTPAMFQDYYLSYYMLIKDIDIELFGTADFDYIFYSKLTKSKQISSKETLLANYLNPSNDIYFQYSDSMHLRHLIESKYHFERIDCLFQNVIQTATLFSYSTIFDHLDKTMSCSKLPPFPIFNYLVNVLFDRLNNFSFELTFSSYERNIILEKFLSYYEFFINTLTEPNGLLATCYYHFRDSLFKSVETAFTIHSLVDIEIQTYKLIMKYINDMDHHEYYYLFPGSDALSNRKIFPESIHNKSLSDTDFRNVLISISTLLKDYPNLQCYIDKALEFTDSGSEALRNLSYLDLTIEPFKYSKCLDVLKPQKNNLHWYDQCIRLMNAFSTANQ